MAACDSAATQSDRGNPHINTIAHDYADHPATSGPHFPVPLPPQPAVYTAPWPESRAVHNLEHGYVLVYYRAAGTAALPEPVVAALAAAVPGQRKVLMAPYADLPAGKALAFAAWDVLQLCSSEVTVDEARAKLTAFVGAHRESPVAPEPRAG
ncbi:MAG: hypothetical protein NVS9B1_06760 [Candidatus Dormibacteraceae bacterium]